MKIKQINPAFCTIARKEGRKLIPCMSYKAEYWKPVKIGTKTRKKRVSYTKDVFIKSGEIWTFHTGLLQTIEAYCKRNRIPLLVNGKTDPLLYSPPQIKGIVFRNDQLELIEIACEKQRGVIQAPTGMGKTILQMGIISSFPKLRTLILAHNVSLVDQTYAELQEKGFKKLQKIRGGDDKTLVGRIVVSTMQSFIQIPPEEYCDKFGCVIIDEGHHVSKPDGTYGKILSKLNAPIRLAFTATLPTSSEAKFALTGLIGPLIGRQTIEEAANLNILAKPKIRLIRTKKNTRIYDIRNYREAYNEGIVLNESRNKLVMQTAKEYIDEGKSVLIFVSKLEHGEELQKTGKIILNNNIHFVQGNMEKEMRTHIKKCLINKSLLIAISTTVWREGMDIPNLDVVINACGGKSEIMTLQTIGRGLRKTEDKEHVIIVDFFDPSNRFFISHFGERVCLYFDNSWL